MEGAEVQPHIRLCKGQVCPIVITVGDPGRSRLIAEMSDSYLELAFNREYRSFNCSKDGFGFTVISHGIGSSGAAICFQELIYCGAKFIIRAGTAGSLCKQLKTGSIFIAYGAIREEGTTRLMVPEGFPAVASPVVFQALSNAARDLDVKYSDGIIVTSDLFYKPEIMPSTLETYAKANAKAVGMEESVLFVIGTLRDVLTGSIHVIDGSPLAWDSNDYDPSGDGVNEGKENMINICFKAVKTLSLAYLS